MVAMETKQHRKLLLWQKVYLVPLNTVVEYKSNISKMIFLKFGDPLRKVHSSLTAPLTTPLITPQPQLYRTLTAPVTTP